ncbi:hypothetical protein [Natronorarus salvus]|uniref:hypothetical protein n=1 Tax=Natronorarus salvus TaxID=3117733 RepID=UPI002F25EC4E
MSSFPSTEWLELAALAIAEDPQFERTSRAFDATIRFDFGDDAYAVTVDETDLTVHEDPTFVGWDFALRAPEDTWRKMFSETPSPLHHDLLGAWLRGPMTIEGDLKTAIQHIRPLKRMLVVFQEVNHD